MRKTTNNFGFAISDGWQVFEAAGRLVAHGPSGEELILSSWSVQGPQEASEHEFEGLVDQLVENALKAARSAASDPQLHITQALSSVAAAGGVFPCWTLFAETTSRDLFFGQAVVRGARAVLLATLEAPYTPKRSAEFEQFLSTFERGEGAP